MLNSLAMFGLLDWLLDARGFFLDCQQLPLSSTSSTSSPFESDLKIMLFDLLHYI